VHTNTHGSHLLLLEPLDRYFANTECSQNFILPHGQIGQKWQLTECSHSLILQYKVREISEVLYNALTNTLTFSGTNKQTLPDDQDL
jgi:hypothetical protein